MVMAHFDGSAGVEREGTRGVGFSLDVIWRIGGDDNCCSKFLETSSERDSKTYRV